jgi:hypothetical protein
MSTTAKRTTADQLARARPSHGEGGARRSLTSPSRASAQRTQLDFRAPLIREYPLCPPLARARPSHGEGGARGSLISPSRARAQRTQ